MANIRTLNDVRGGGGGGGNRGNPPPFGGHPGGDDGRGPGGGGLASLFGGMIGGMGGGQSHGNVKEIGSRQELSQELRLAGDRLVVVDFGASWCGPCRMIAPIFAQLSQQHSNVVFLKVDIDVAQDLAQEHNVRSVPTFVFFRNSSKLDTVSGANEPELRSRIQQYSAPSRSSGSSVGGQVLGEGQPLGGGQTLGGGGQPLGGGRPLGGGQSLGGGQTLGGGYSLRSDQPQDEESPFLSDLLDMGFPLHQAQQALRASNNRSVQDAIDWIFNNPQSANLPAVAQAPTTATPDSRPAEASSEPQATDSSTVTADQGESDSNVSMSTEPTAPKEKAPAETEEQQRLLQERLAKLRKEQAEDEESRERERELSRRRQGKDAAEAKAQWEEQKAKRELEAAKREKEEEKRAKEKLRKRLEQDKLNRHNQFTYQETKQPAAPPPQTNYAECLLQLRFPDGRTATHQFPATATLREVHNYVNSVIGSGNYSLVVPGVPRKTYNGAVLDSTTVKQADLVPRGAVIVSK